MATPKDSGSTPTGPGRRTSAAESAAKTGRVGAEIHEAAVEAASATKDTSVAALTRAAEASEKVTKATSDTARETSEAIADAGREVVEASASAASELVERTIEIEATLRSASAETVGTVTGAVVEAGQAVGKLPTPIIEAAGDISRSWAVAVQDQARRNIEAAVHLAACRSVPEAARLQRELVRDSLYAFVDTNKAVMERTMQAFRDVRQNLPHRGGDVRSGV